MNTIGGVTFSDDYDKFNITEEDVDFMKFKIYVDLVMDDLWRVLDKAKLGDEVILDWTLSDERIKQHISWLHKVKGDLMHPHSGDCTNEPFTCIRCVLERDQWDTHPQGGKES